MDFSPTSNGLDVFTPGAATTKASNTRREAKSGRSHRRGSKRPTGDGRIAPKARLAQREENLTSSAAAPSGGRGPRGKVTTRVTKNSTSRAVAGARKDLHRNITTTVIRRNRKLLNNKRGARESGTHVLLGMDIEYEQTNGATNRVSQSQRALRAKPRKRRRQLDTMLAEEKAYLQCIHALPRKKTNGSDRDWV